LRGCSVGTDDREGFMENAAEVTLGGMIYIPSFTKIGGVQAILRF
jgi:hypothetical protein